MTRSLKAENIPDNVSTDYLTVYFENTQNGGGPLSDIQLFPEENSAIITFCDHKGKAASVLAVLLVFCICLGMFMLVCDLVLGNVF